MLVPPGDECHLCDRLPAPLVVLVPVDALDHDGPGIDEQLPAPDPHIPEADLQIHVSRVTSFPRTANVKGSNDRRLIKSLQYDGQGYMQVIKGWRSRLRSVFQLSVQMQSSRARPCQGTNCVSASADLAELDYICMETIDALHSLPLQYQPALVVDRHIRTSADRGSCIAF